jgi:hypothetical protein
MSNIEREPAEYVECDGSADCEAHEHIEGCYATMRPDAGEVERLSRQLAGAVGALRGVVRIGTAPRDSMRSNTRQYQERGQAMVDVANAALGGQWAHG